MNKDIKVRMINNLAETKKLKARSYKNTLKTAQLNHRILNKKFSKLLHANGMDDLHEYLSITLIHPKVLLAGSIMSLAGSIFSIYMAEIYGYQYNYLLFVYYFLFGYLIEMIYLTVTLKLRK
jgi:hypothetical protein